MERAVMIAGFLAGLTLLLGDGIGFFAFIPPVLLPSHVGSDAAYGNGPWILAKTERRAGPCVDSAHPYALFGRWLALKNYDPPEDQSLASSP